ncbi:SDR family NAD(P)-dependent oxidoreductase [Roseofilum reptotaenium CS-1145]|uniref:Carrier domain-containing protein n=1 Tax=Roseofilum reptotaenium AO1-A TaxID=1925591 RepID=A0A1L9QPG6_9CYAN|nr:SDR family NAD(P)-dependent oxidoreductase [Roseofilum reptotaenium]MDB9520158.1 SDR family NAD(P)-dependent oxidoreductase [Roseofilum reptotaenium CS-1145]OJJ24487.1 hypothetical protein BI308_16385 [Roseofilum reptotaenium AO1-A]
MNLVEFLQDLSIQGWKLWSDNGGLSYDAPGDRSIDAVLAQLKEHKDEILRLLQENPGILQVYPLSYSQQAMWFLWQLAPESHAFNSSLALRICSTVDVVALHQTCQTLLERYPIWRTIFPQRGQEPIQQVLEDRSIDFQPIKSSTLTEEQLKAQVIAAHQEAFELQQGPIVRVRLFTRAENDHVLLVTTHHIANDIWSIDILLQELPQIYQSIQEGVQETLPQIQYSYLDYVRWQRNLLASDRGEKLWNYWHQKLAGANGILPLPCDRPRPLQQTYNGTYHLFTLSEDLSAKLQELAQQESSTLYMVLLAAYQVLLYRYTQQDEILVGSLTSGRTQPEFAPIFGYFTNPVVMKANCAGYLSFRQFLAQVKQTVLEALAHQDFPFSLLVERLQDSRDPSRPPIFQTMFALHKLQQSQSFQNLMLGEDKTLNNWGGLAVKPFDIPMAEGQFDLTLEITKTESSLIGIQKYNTDLFDPETIVRMVGHFQVLLAGIITNPDCKLSQLPLLTETEKQDLININHDPAKNEGFDSSPIHILDAFGQRVPLGIEGELYTSDRSLSSEQSKSFDHPELGRLYSTGEWGKRSGNGTLERLGEVKRIVSVKGRRVNLQAVEEALHSLADIQQCSVCGDRQGELVAYIVPSNPLSLSSIELQIKSELPVELQPSVRIPVVALPYTQQGKIDTDRLAQLEAIDSELVEQWQEQLDKISSIEQVAVVIEPKKFAPPSLLHLWDLLPEDNLSISEPDASSASDRVSSSKNSHSRLNIPAMSEGGELQFPEKAPQNLSEALIQAAQNPSETGLIYLNADGSEERQSYTQLLHQAQCILAGLRQRGLKPQDKVIFQLENSQDFIPAFWGCVLGGFIPAPLSFPVNSDWSKLQNTLELLEFPLVLTTRNHSRTLEKWAQELKWSNVQVATLEDLQTGKAETDYYSSQLDELALLILTSGSTGKPKGVMLTHGNILSRSEGAKRCHEYSSKDVSLNWFPLDHVVGLVMFHIRDVYLGCQQIQAHINMVLNHPVTWIDWLEKYQVTVTWAPNFAYGLINAQSEAIEQGHWDLSSVRHMINGGEAIVDKTARQFMQLLTPHQLIKTAMKPAWGMSETSSGIVFSKDYTWDGEREDMPFVDLGLPISGVSLRIVNEQNKLLEEGEIGQIQIQGVTVTQGYYNNREKQEEAFTPDSWFKTGDLGFLQEGRLTITGRQKDVIIINGINYYSHEIEAVVEELEEVEVSYTAACGVRQRQDDSDRLAVFFSPKNLSDSEKIQLLKKIRTQVIQSMGINPDFLIPVHSETIPKTAIGKIQRSQLKQRFEAGEFKPILKQVDLLLENQNTLPNWFYRQIWQPKAVEGVYLQPHKGLTLIFFEGEGLARGLVEQLTKHHQSYIQVIAGSEFTQIDEQCYSIAPDRPEHYQQLLESVSIQDCPIAQIIHLGQYHTQTQEISSTEELEAAQEQGLYSLLFLSQALEKNGNLDQPLQLFWVTSLTQRVEPSDRIAPEKATVLGLVKTLPQEIPGFACRHIDLSVTDTEEEQKTDLWQELCTVCPDVEIAYRHGKRYTSGLQVVPWDWGDKPQLPFKPGGTYLLSGGLGGIGVKVAQYLLRTYHARLLLVGRTPLPLLTSEKQDTYQQLQTLPGEVIYQAVDIAHEQQVHQAVHSAIALWGSPLDGVIHLAGTLQEKPVLSETQASVAEVLRPKVLGTWVLHQLVKDHPKSIFIHFASVNGFLGGSTVGAYAAANSFQGAFSEYQNAQTPVQSYGLAWSMWDEIGMSQGYQMKELSQAKGYCAIAPSQGLTSLLATLSQPPGYWFIGLDSTKPYIQYLLSNCQNLQQLTAYFTSGEKWAVNPWQDLQVRDLLGTLTHCEGVQLEEMPLTETGDIDLRQLLGSNLNSKDPQNQQPRTPTEHQLVQIFEAVLKVSPVGIYDNFFELGGHSLLATQLVSRICQTFEIDIPLNLVFQSSTLLELAERIDGICTLLVDAQVNPTEDLQPGEEEIEL